MKTEKKVIRRRVRKAVPGQYYFAVSVTSENKSSAEVTSFGLVKVKTVVDNGYLVACLSCALSYENSFLPTQRNNLVASELAIFLSSQCFAFYLATKTEVDEAKEKQKIAAYEKVDEIIGAF